MVYIAAFQAVDPGSISRPTHLGGVPFLLESVTSSLRETCLPHGSKSFAVVQTHAEENTLSRLPLIILI